MNLHMGIKCEPCGQRGILRVRESQSRTFPPHCPDPDLPNSVQRMHDRRLATTNGGPEGADAFGQGTNLSARGYHRLAKLFFPGRAPRASDRLWADDESGVEVPEKKSTEVGAKAVKAQ